MKYIRQYFALFRLFIVEEIRSRNYLVMWLSLAGIFAVSYFLSQLTFAEQERVITDVVLALSHLLLLFFAIRMGSASVSKDIEKKLLHMILVRPVTRIQYLFARIGTLKVLLVSFSFAIFFFLKIFIPELLLKNLVISFFGFYLELLTLGVIAFALANFFSTPLAAMCTLVIYSVGHSLSDIKFFADKYHIESYQRLYKVFYYLFPHLSEVNWKTHYFLTETRFVDDIGKWSWPIVHIIAWCLFAVLIATAGFRRRNLV